MKEESGWECVCAYGWLETLSMNASKNKRIKGNYNIFLQMNTLKSSPECSFKYNEDIFSSICGTKLKGFFPFH